jgi:hypothetical protein
MYQFRTLTSLYSVAVTYRLPDYTEQRYDSKIVVKAQRKKEKYLFTLEERFGIQLNNEAPQKVMDRLMTQLGNSLYPIELYVSERGELLAVPNFEQIKNVWLKTAKELLRQNKTLEFKNYLEAAQMNLSDEQKFLKVLPKDNFIQLFFKDYAENKVELAFVNFPFQNRKTNYYVRKIPNIHNSYALFPAFKEAGIQETGGKLFCRKNRTCGEPFTIEANIHLITSDADLYQKRVLIEAGENEHKVKTGIFF